MNWKRTTREIKVKLYEFPIIVDECVADAVLFIDVIPDTKTCWSCCGHGHKEGATIEFVSDKSSKVLEEIILHQFPGEIKECSWCGGYMFISHDLCKCSIDIRKRAMEHFSFTPDEMEIYEN